MEMEEHVSIKNKIDNRDADKDLQGNKNEKKFDVEHPDCSRIVRGKKALLSKKTEKTYKVTVTYVQLSDEEANMKRATIESIIKKTHV